MKLVAALRQRREVRRNQRFPGCTELVCRSQLPHRQCVDCGQLCDSTMLRIDPATLRRRRRPVCFACQQAAQYSYPGERTLRQKRTNKDWAELTDPIDSKALRLGELPEQNPGLTRATVRAFRESTETTTVVDGIDAATLNQSIGSLGLNDLMYAETRGKRTVLRKVKGAS